MYSMYSTDPNKLALYWFSRLTDKKLYKSGRHPLIDYMPEVINSSFKQNAIKICKHCKKLMFHHPGGYCIVNRRMTGKRFKNYVDASNHLKVLIRMFT